MTTLTAQPPAPLLEHLARRAHPCETELFLAQPLSSLLAQHAVELARARHEHFGRRVLLFAPLYVANACMNDCSYCGFRRSLRVRRQRLGPGAVLREAKLLAERGHRSLDLVAGEVPRDVFIDSVARVVDAILRRTAIERIHLNLGVLSDAQFRRLRDAGAVGYHLYQETYDAETYARVHVAGPKSAMEPRLEAIARAHAAGFERIGLGILLGLAPLAPELARLVAHAEWLAEQAPDVRLGFSLPRIQRVDDSCGFQTPAPVDDETFLRALLFLRLKFPRAELTVTTRERAELRDRSLALGVTKLSAGVSTAPGGYGQSDDATPQFSIHDERSFAEVAQAVRASGLEPVAS